MPALTFVADAGIEARLAVDIHVEHVFVQPFVFVARIDHIGETLFSVFGALVVNRQSALHEIGVHQFL